MELKIVNKRYISEEEYNKYTHDDLIEYEFIEKFLRKIYKPTITNIMRGMFNRYVRYDRYISAVSKAKIIDYNTINLVFHDDTGYLEFVVQLNDYLDLCEFSILEAIDLSPIYRYSNDNTDIRFIHIDYNFIKSIRNVTDNFDNMVEKIVNKPLTDNDLHYLFLRADIINTRVPYYKLTPHIVLHSNLAGIKFTGDRFINVNNLKNNSKELRRDILNKYKSLDLQGYPMDTAISLSIINDIGPIETVILLKEISCDKLPEYSDLYKYAMWHLDGLLNSELRKDVDLYNIKGSLKNILMTKKPKVKIIQNINVQ